jgi:hypothetical protein
MALPLDSSFTLRPLGNQMDNAGAAPRVLQIQMRQDYDHSDVRFLKRRLFYETPSSAVGVLRVTPFEPLVHRRNLPTTGHILRSASSDYSNPSQAPTRRDQNYQQYPNRYPTPTPTQDKWQHAAFDPPITRTRDLHKRRSTQLNYAYNHSREQMREMKEDQRQMKARIAELEGQLLRAQSGTDTAVSLKLAVLSESILKTSRGLDQAKHRSEPSLAK